MIFARSRAIRQGGRNVATKGSRRGYKGGMKTVGRWAGWLLVLLAVAAAVYDGLAALREGSYHVSSLGELWFALHRGSLGLAQEVVQRYLFPWLWDPAIATLLTWPAVAVFGVPGVLLVALCRGRRDPRRRHRRYHF